VEASPDCVALGESEAVLEGAAEVEGRLALGTLVRETKPVRVPVAAPVKVPETETEKEPVADGECEPEGEADADAEPEGEPDEHDDADADGQADTSAEAEGEPDALAVSDAAAEIDAHEGDAVPVMTDAVMVALAAAESEAQGDFVADADGAAVKVGMTRLTRPTPRNSLPSALAVTTVATAEVAKADGSSRKPSVTTWSAAAETA